jgi:oxygen-dependent protoporphyrinogen oxidase
MNPVNAQPHVVIVGGGISGLAAAFFLRDADVRVTVLEGSPRLGGKLSVSEIAGVAVDEGAEALLVTRPEGTGLIAAAGLADQRVSPDTTSSAIWTLGALRPLPRRQFMGVPSDLSELAKSGVLSDSGIARAHQDLELPPTERAGDVPVARYVGARFGDEVVNRLVDPLLGGVYAGRSTELSFDATLPALAAASRKHRSLAEAAQSLLPPDAGAPAGAGTRAGGSVFTTLAGGLGTLPGFLAQASAAQVRTASMARELSRTEHGWRLTVGSAAAPEYIDADAVIIAIPARPAGRLLAEVPGVSAAVTAFGEISYASMAIVTLAYPRSAGGGLSALGWSGYLVPAVDGRAVKATTFSTVKWPHLTGATARTDEPLEIVRCSVGRMGEEALLQRADDDLAALAAAELAEATGAGGAPIATRVTRWGGGLPQYTVGHLDRVARIRAAVATQPGLAVCGAAYDGVGIPACVKTASAAVDQVLAYLPSKREPGPAR